MEAQNNPPSLAEVNATRRLIDWLNWRARVRAGESAVDPVKGFAKSWAQWRRDREAERFDAIADRSTRAKL